MFSKLLSLFLVFIFAHYGYAQEKNKYNPYSQPKKWKKEEVRLQKEREAAKATMKVWEFTDGKDYKIYESDGYTASFTPAFTRNAKDFIALVSTRKKGDPFSLHDINFEYRGACSEQVLVKATSIMYTHEKLQKYFETGNLKDAPIEGMLNALVKGLRDQCDDLESVRITIGPVHFPRKDGAQKVVTLTANMRKAMGWKLETGFGPSLDGLEIKFRIHPALGSKLAIRYDGQCNNTQKLQIAPVFSNNTERYAYNT